MPSLDLSGIFYVQQQYLADLNALTYNNNQPASGPTVNTYVNELRGNLSDAYNQFRSAAPTANALLTRQTDMQTIIDTENQRLADKMNTVDSALFGQRRMAQFASSYSKKYYAQIKILFVIIILLLIYLALTYIDNFIPVPTMVWVIVVLLFGGTGLLVIIFTIRDINQRYHMDFDKLDTHAPSDSDARGGNGNANYQGTNSNLFCVGESCCPPGNKNGAFWDANGQQCVSQGTSVGQPTTPTASGFTVMSASDVSPYAPSENTRYTKI